MMGIFSWSTAGESHGPTLIISMEGVPARVRISSTGTSRAFAQWRQGHRRGARQKFERGELTVLSRIRHGKTIGSSIALEIGNFEWSKRHTATSAGPVSPSELIRDAGAGDPCEIARNKLLTKPRSGHANLMGMNRYDFDDVRPVLECASAREATIRAALGTIAATVNGQTTGVSVLSRVVRIGKAADENTPPGSDAVEVLDANPVRCLNPAVEAVMVTEIGGAKKNGGTLDDVVEVLVYGVPQGLDTYATPMSRFDARLAVAAISIQSIKGAEIDDGFAGAGRRENVAYDEIVRKGSLRRLANRAGGVKEGMFSDEIIRIRLAFRPVSVVPRVPRMIDTATGEPATALHQHSDIMTVVLGAVVAEAMVSLIVTQALIKKIEGDYADQIHESLVAHLAPIPKVRA